MMTGQTTFNLYKIKKWIPNGFGEEYAEVVGLLFIDAGYDQSLVDQYLDGDEITQPLGEFKQIGSPGVLNHIPSIFRIELDE